MPIKVKIQNQKQIHKPTKAAFPILFNWKSQMQKGGVVSLVIAGVFPRRRRIVASGHKNRHIWRKLCRKTLGMQTDWRIKKTAIRKRSRSNLQTFNDHGLISEPIKFFLQLFP